MQVGLSWAPVPTNPRQGHGVTVAVLMAQPECLPDETLGDSGRRGMVGEGDGGWVGPGWSWGGQAAGWGQGG